MANKMARSAAAEYPETKDSSAECSGVASNTMPDDLKLEKKNIYYVIQLTHIYYYKNTLAL